MKKLIAVLLAMAMVLSVAACGNKEETPAAEKPEASGKSASAEAHENKLICGFTAALTGDFTGGLVDQGASDMLVSNLVNGYATMVTNQYGEYVANPTVMESCKRKDNADGSATYTIKIKEGLVYSNGEDITAKDFVVRQLLGCSDAASALGIRSSAYDEIVGGREYRAGEADVVSGIRILDEYTLSLSITEAYADYYYADTYAALLCWNPAFWLGEGWDVADNGEGAAFTFHGEICRLDGAAVLDHFNSSRNASRGEFVSAGPYNLEEYDRSTGRATLTINPDYQGNFEGQKPSIETLVITKIDDAEWAEDLKSGNLNLYEGITDGDDINTVLDMIDSGAELQHVQYDRAGYGKLQFFCDVTPTQFIEVRHAIAMLLDRVAFADAFCKGWGGIVNGPYALSMYQYQERKDRLSGSLNPYAYDVEGAIAALEEGGWTLNAEGGAYTDGLRYKEVTEQQAQYMDECVTLSDGRILMPLIIKWCSSENNPVTEQLSPMLVNSEPVNQAGMKITLDVMDFNTLFGNIYRMDDAGNPAEPHYSMTNQVTIFDSVVYDHAYFWTDDPAFVEQGWNSCYLYDMDEGGLDDLSMRMVYGDVVGKEKQYLDLWAEYVERWNDLLPELPLYSNIYITALPAWVEGYDQSAMWDFSNAILYASIPSAQ